MKSDIPQSACSTRQERDAHSGKSVLMHIAGSMDSVTKGPKRLVTKLEWPC